MSSTPEGLPGANGATPPPRHTGGEGPRRQRPRIERLLAGMRHPDNPLQTIFFKGRSFRTYDWASNRLVDAGTSPSFLLHLPAAFQYQVDAILDGHGRFSGYTYLFKGGDCCVYNRGARRPEREAAPYARSWNLPAEFADHLDGAVNGKGPFENKAYFFKQDRYARYDWTSNRVDFVAPLAAFDLPEEFSSGIDTVVNGAGPYEGKAYFFKGDHYVRYDWRSGKIDGGPRPIADHWPALLGLEEAPRRRFLVYVTLDSSNHRNHGNGGPGKHTTNLSGLWSAVQHWQPEAEIVDLWCGEIDESLLSDPHVLAMFLSGSYDEWFMVFHDAGWRAELESYCRRIRNTDVPILAVCGSHQLVAYAYADWNAVGHMATAGNEPVTIAREGAEGRFLAPNPRLGEFGVFALRKDGEDPLLAGLPDLMTFRQSHYDQVVFPPPGAVSLLKPTWEVPPEQASRHAIGSRARAAGEDPEQFLHREISTPDELCRIQLLGYRIPGRRKILYSTQFHPELPAGDTASTLHGHTLIRNFLDIASGYWTDS